MQRLASSGLACASFCLYGLTSVSRSPRAEPTANSTFSSRTESLHANSPPPMLLNSWATPSVSQASARASVRRVKRAILNTRNTSPREDSDTFCLTAYLSSLCLLYMYGIGGIYSVYIYIYIIRNSVLLAVYS